MSTVALLTDFGTRDHYAGTMKGVVLSVCPGATLVDLTHDVPPQDLCTGALQLSAAYRYFPAGTVFLAVVDPGVGSDRRGLAAEAGGYFFVAPDNGLLTEVFRETPPVLVVELRERRYARSTISRTFEGRDRFAPAAGWLARGAALATFGPPLVDYVRLDLPRPVRTGAALHGEVLIADRFGNLITNIDRAAVAGLRSGTLRVSLGDRILAAVTSTYAESPAGVVCALFGSSDRLEIAVNGGSAADQLGLGRGAAVTVTVEE